MEIKDIIRIKRIENGMTMKELAVKVGVSEGTISRWESGDIANMKRDKIVALADALGISPLIIMGIDDSFREKEVREIFKKAMKDFKEGPRFTLEEVQLVNAFNSADAVTQGIVRKILGLKEG